MADQRLIPAGIKDKSSEAINDILDRFTGLDLYALLMIYDIDAVNETALPCLAEQFHVMGDEGWGHCSSVAEKRALLKQAIELHRLRGTKWAIRRVLELLGFEGDCREWFEYSGQPYRFMLELGRESRPLTEQAWLDALSRLVDANKNERSRLEKITQQREQQGSLFAGGVTRYGRLWAVGIGLEFNLPGAQVHAGGALRYALSMRIDCA